jgi:ATP-dependent HslUV protease ATP-binding subunit HslU
MERLLEDVSYTAPDRSERKVVVDADFVDRALQDLAGNEDLSRYIL